VAVKASGPRKTLAAPVVPVTVPLYGTHSVPVLYRTGVSVPSTAYTLYICRPLKSPTVIARVACRFSVQHPGYFHSD
jgi:hypothetical protein